MGKRVQLVYVRLNQDYVNKLCDVAESLKRKPSDQAAIVIEWWLDKNYPELLKDHRKAKELLNGD